jgi:hypothetical protein
MKFLFYTGCLAIIVGLIPYSYSLFWAVVLLGDPPVPSMDKILEDCEKTWMVLFSSGSALLFPFCWSKISVRALIAKLSIVGVLMLSMLGIFFS